MVIPREMKNIDTLELCKLLSITKEDFIKKITKAKKYSPRLPSVFIPQLNKREYAGFQEKERKFEGFYTQKRALRDYQVHYGANIFGFIAQVNEATTKANPYYNSGDLIGKQGLEKEYEEVLRGVKGVRITSYNVCYTKLLREIMTIAWFRLIVLNLQLNYKKSKAEQIRF